MHHHNDDAVPEGYIPMLAEYDPEENTFSVTICLNGLHILVAMPIGSPQTLGLLAALAPALGQAFVAILCESMEINDDIKAKVKDAMDNLESAEAFLNKLDVIAPDQIVRQAQMEGGD
jgi:hypothetical protein